MAVFYLQFESFIICFVVPDIWSGYKIVGWINSGAGDTDVYL